MKQSQEVSLTELEQLYDGVAMWYSIRENLTDGFEFEFRLHKQAVDAFRYQTEQGYGTVIPFVPVTGDNEREQHSS